MDLVSPRHPAGTRGDETMVKARGGAAARGLARRDDAPGHDGERRRARARIETLRARGELTARIYVDAEPRHRPASLLPASRPASATTGCASAESSSSPTDRWAPAPLPSSSRMRTIRQRAGCSSTPGRLREADRSRPTRHGFQLVVHAIGDRANALVLDIFERLARRARRRRDWRPRIEHAQVVRPSRTSTRFKRARRRSRRCSRATASTTCAGRRRRIGKARSAIAYNVRSFVDAGARIAFGTDWFVEPLNPMLGLYAAVTRQFAGWHPGRRLVPGGAHHAGSGRRVLHAAARRTPNSPNDARAASRQESLPIS